MNTLYHRLQKYCADNEIDMPSAMEIQLLGKAVSNSIMNTKRTVEVSKVNIIAEVPVNLYPDDCVDIIDEVIKTFFTDNEAIHKLYKGKNRTFKLRYFVEAHKSSAFDKALAYVNISAIVKKQSPGDSGGKAVSYIILVTDPSLLIKLGKRFQKERNMERYLKKANTPEKPKK